MAPGDIIIVAIVLVVVAMVLMAVVVVRQYKKVPPDQAMVVFGRKRGDRAYVVVGPGGAKFIAPLVEAYRMFSLEAYHLRIGVPNVITRSGVPLNVDLVAVFGISRAKTKLDEAAGRLLGISRNDLESMVTELLIGHTRGVCATLEVEQINSDRDALSAKIRESAGPDLDNLGLEVISMAIRDIADTVGYLEALGKRRTAEVIRDAIVAEATARKQAVQLSAEQDVESQKIRFKADAQIAAAQAERDAAIEASKKEATTRYARAK